MPGGRADRQVNLGPGAQGSFLNLSLIGPVPYWSPSNTPLPAGSYSLFVELRSAVGAKPNLKPSSKLPAAKTRTARGAMA